MRRIRITFETITPESAERGDTSDDGWVDPDGTILEPDADDIEEHGSLDAAAAHLAVKFIEDRGPVEPSQAPAWGPRTWYTTTTPIEDYATGAETRHAFHLAGYTEEEEREVYRLLTRPLADKLRDAGRAIHG